MIKKFINEYDIRTYECDRNNNLRILTLLNIFQDMADNHAKSMGLGIDYVLSKGLAWVGANYVLDIKRLPKVHEKIRIETWPSEEKRVGANTGRRPDWKKAIVTIDTNPTEKTFPPFVR